MENTDAKLGPYNSLFLILFIAASAATPSLRQAADQAHVLVGAAVRPSLFSEAAYSETLAREFNMVEPEDAMKWWTVRRNADTFDFREGDEVVRFAQAHDMKVRGHCLVWDHNNPEWLTQNHYTPHQLSHVLQEHITTVMKHYAGQVFAWDVVNEALDENGQLRDSLWYNHPGIGLADKGTAYIEQAFRWAHEADPHALLFYNDNGGEGLNRKSDAIYAMVKDFKQRGVPIDGVGLQMHIPKLELDTAAVAANIARLTALGVQVHITELDVSLPVDSDGVASKQDLLRQAEIYRGIVRACLQSRAALRFKPGDSPTNIPGSDRTPTAPAAQPCPSTAPTSQNPPTTPCSKRSRKVVIVHIKRNLSRRSGPMRPRTAGPQCLPSGVPTSATPTAASAPAPASIMTCTSGRFSTLTRARARMKDAVHPTSPIPPQTSRRKQVIILLAISVFLLLAILVSQTAFDQTFLRPGNNQDIVVFAALSALIFLLFVALTFVLMRNLLKLFAERRLGVLGSKFRTRMVAGALLLSSCRSW